MTHPLRPIVTAFVLLIALTAVAEFGGKGSSSQGGSSSVQINVQCSPQSIYANQSSSCTANVVGGSSPTFQWGINGGSVYPQTGVSAKFTPLKPGVFTITASATGQYTQGSATVAVNAPKVQSVVPTCNPSSILTTGLSNCSAVVNGKGLTNTGVSWAASNGTISSNGVYSPSAPGTITITAIALQDRNTNGTTRITARVPPSISSVKLTCSPALIKPTGTSTCVPTVRGQGSFSSAVTWKTNVGQINKGTFTPIGVERATITATSVEDPTKSASFVVDSDIEWTLGTQIWGADGQNPIGAYYEIPLSTPGETCKNGTCPSQIAALKNVFGTTPNTIMYRAWDYDSGVLSSDLITAQMNAIIPLVGFATYLSSTDTALTPCGKNNTQQPGWTTWYALGSAAEQEAYRWADCRATLAAQQLKTNLYWYVGNEFLGINWSLLPPACQKIVNGTTPAAWEHPVTGNPCYPLFRGVMAGSIKGLRESLGYVRIIAGMDGGNGSEGLAVALATDLANKTQNKSGKPLAWDLTSMHWASDAANNRDGTGSYSAQGPPDSYYCPCPLPAPNRDFYATVGLAGKPIILTEISSSDGQNPKCSNKANSNAALANDSLAADQTKGILDNMKAHAFALDGETGVVGGLLYELFQQPVDATANISKDSAEIDRFLYWHQADTSVGTISTQGAAIQAWVKHNANPTVITNPAFSLGLSMTSGTTVSVGGSVSAKVSLIPSSFGGSATLSYRAWATEPNTPNNLPECSFGDSSVSAFVPVIIVCSIHTGIPSGTYIVSIYGTNGSATVPTNFTFMVQ